MQWHMQAGNITTNIKVEVDFTLPELSFTDVVTWKCHVDESAKGRYDVILGRDILTKLGLNLELYDHVIEANDGTFKGCTVSMVDLGMHEFEDLNIEQLHLKNRL